MVNFGFNLYLVFIISWLLRFGRRLPNWGVFRLDLVLVVVLAILSFLIFMRRKENIITNDKTWQYLKYLIIFVVSTIPFVEWPGSVIKYGLENFIKAVVFFYFTILFVNDENKLKTLVLVIILCQIFRVAEPLCMHLNEGYWGSQAAMAGSEGMEMMNRLSGSPYDTVNPNGLAYVIVFTMPLLHFLSYSSWTYKLLYACSIPFLLYALILTGSRSGLVAFSVVLIGIIAKAKHKWLVIAIICCAVIFTLPRLGADLADRYESIFSSETKNAATAEGRISGIIRDFKVALRKPLVGHGLGTSMEANFNISRTNLRSHNLYTELMQEIGFLGFFIFLGFLISLAKNLWRNNNYLHIPDKKDNYVPLLSQALLVQYLMNVIFSFFSYGLSTYPWYLIAGLSVTIANLTYKEHGKYQ
jgi:hypothetical protein